MGTILIFLTVLSLK